MLGCVCLLEEMSLFVDGYDDEVMNDEVHEMEGEIFGLDVIVFGKVCLFELVFLELDDSITELARRKQTGNGTKRKETCYQEQEEENLLPRTRRKLGNNE